MSRETEKIEVVAEMLRGVFKKIPPPKSKNVEHMKKLEAIKKLEIYDFKIKNGMEAST